MPFYVDNAFGLSTALSLLTLLLIFIGICLFKRPWDIRIAVLHIVVGTYTQILRGSFHALERMEYETKSQTTGRIFINCQRVCVICCDLECGG